MWQHPYTDKNEIDLFQIDPKKINEKKLELVDDSWAWLMLKIVDDSSINLFLIYTNLFFSIL